MELKTINTFLKVSTTQNFSKAAEQLGYSQSAVTVQIQKLERELDVPLFERIGKKVYLTEQGKKFIPYANEIIKASNAALTFSKQEESIKGSLRIGGVESVCTALLPKLLLGFYKLCPEVEVIIKSGTTTEMLTLAESNELDLILTLDKKIYQPDFKCELEKEEKIILTTLKKDSDSNDRVIPLRQLCEEPFILTETGASYRYELEQILAKRNLEIRPILETGNTETIINLLKQGMGISFLPQFTVENDIKNNTLMQIHTDCDEVKMHLQLLCHKRKWVTPQMEIFTKLVDEYLKDK